VKIFLCFLLIISALTVNGQRNSELVLIKKKLTLKSNSIYFFCRGTKSKSKLIAEKFNISDTNITHVGIGFFNNKKLMIYNVSDNYASENALRIDSIDSFINSLDVYYFSVWRCNISLTGYNKIKSICEEYSKRKIYFDFSFTISNDDTLYCSEFCAAVLSKAKVKDLLFHPIIMDLNNLIYESILNRKSLTYFPVDFFQSNEIITKVFDYKFKGWTEVTSGVLK